MYLSKLPPGTEIIDDSNWHRYADPRANEEVGNSRGLIPRDFSRQPVGSLGYARSFDLPLIDRAEWPERIADHEKYGSDITSVGKRRGVELSFQNGVGYCWIFAVAKAVELARVMAGLPHVPLSPASVGCKIKNFRDQGGWCGEGVEYVMDGSGFVPTSMWPDYSLKRSHDTAAADAERPKYSITEVTELISVMERKPSNMFDRMATCELNGFPICAGHNWWGHAVCHATLVKVGANSYGNLIWNSHRKFQVLEESRAAAEDAIAIRVTTAS